ncbi:MAG: iron-containing alcohol dehydrogenase [Verrucomicrobiales bacterium]|nr:iron-containing alcohol dehydrogenase [Verrucomicrobiales bacterium]
MTSEGLKQNLAGFDYTPRPRIVFGVDSVERLPEIIADVKGARVLIVTDAGIIKAGHLERVTALLSKEKILYFVYDKVKENPTTLDVQSCLEMAKANNIDCLIGLGGGSSMDTAKGCNFLYTNGGEMKDYWGVGKANKEMLPLVAIPTTSGTGSECQSFALIADEKTHVKMACGDPKAMARVALLDPSLTLSQPFKVTACTGIDAIVHAVETAVTRKRNRLSLMYSHESFKLCVQNLPKALLTPGDIEARSAMLLGAAFAGTAIENSMLGAVHAAANPLTANFGIVHGHAVGIMLPHVVRFNAGDNQALLEYGELASAPEVACVSEGLDVAVEKLIARLESLLNLAQVPRSLEEAGVSEVSIKKLASEAASQWTCHFNPRPVTAGDFEKLYSSAFEKRGEGDSAVI